MIAGIHYVSNIISSFILLFLFSLQKSLFLDFLNIYSIDKSKIFTNLKINKDGTKNNKE